MIQWLLNPDVYSSYDKQPVFIYFSVKYVILMFNIIWCKRTNVETRCKRQKYLILLIKFIYKESSKWHLLCYLFSLWTRVLVYTVFWLCVPEHSVGFLDSNTQHILPDLLLNQQLMNFSPPVESSTKQLQDLMGFDSIFFSRSLRKLVSPKINQLFHLIKVVYIKVFYSMYWKC